MSIFTTAELAYLQQQRLARLATIGPDDVLEIDGIVVALDGSEAVHGRIDGPRAMAAELGRRLGEQLLADGAADILTGAKRTAGAVGEIQP